MIDAGGPGSARDQPFLGQPGPGEAEIVGAVDAAPGEVADEDRTPAGGDREARVVGIREAVSAARPGGTFIGGAMQTEARGREDDRGRPSGDREGIHARRARLLTPERDPGPPFVPAPPQSETSDR